MLTFPFRLLAMIFLALFCYSKWVRRTVAAVVVSAVFVAAQNPSLFAAPSGQPQFVQALALLAGN
jgi:branched-subunit amino acid transport protein